MRPHSKVVICGNWLTKQQGHELIENLVATADLLLLTQLEMFSSLDAQLLFSFAFLALKSQCDLFGGLGLYKTKLTNT